MIRAAAGPLLQSEVRRIPWVDKGRGWAERSEADPVG